MNFHYVAGAVLQKLALIVVLYLPLGASAASNFSTYVAMDDGVRLAVDVWLPEGVSDTDKAPSIVEFTRYWRAFETQPESDNINAWIRQTLDHGYIYVAVDARGSGASFGVREAEFSLAEARDMPQVIDWIAAQPWSNGKVVAMGISYAGNTTEMTALYRSPALVAAVPRFTDYDWFTSIVMPGGLKNAYITERWGAAVQAMDRNDAAVFGEHQGEATADNPKIIGVKPVDDDPDRVLLRRAIAEHAGNKSLADHLGALVYRDEYPSAKSLDDEGRMAVSLHNFEEAFETSAVPMYHWGSWFDAGTAAGVLARFQSFDAPYRYVIGPWSHGANYDANPYKDKDAPVDPSVDQQFDRIFEFANAYMQDGAPAPARELLYYTVGENAWKSTDVWPPPGHRFDRWYLNESGTLSQSPPKTETGSDRYVVDFEAGTGGSSRWSTQLGGGDVFYGDRSAADQRLLTYTSAPLDEALEITGTTLVSLQLSSTHDDGAVIVYLEDVDENGYVRMLTEGELRLRHRATDGTTDSVFGPRRSYTVEHGKALVPGEVTEVKLALLPVSAVVGKGHSIRIAIAGHDKDTFIRVPDEGQPVLEVQRNALTLSSVDLPVIGKTQSPRELTSADVETWGDQLFSRALLDKRMSGAVLTMVQDGKIVLSKGYGYSDLLRETDVDPDNTRFRIGSTTKTFTSLAIAQLLERGLIDSLDDPANKYLQRLTLPTPDGIEITIEHLITHSAGFESRAYNIATDRDYALPLSADEIARYESVVVNPPGAYSSYNNYGTAILALIVEDVTGQPIADYFEEHIFAPLGMSKSILNMSPEPSDGLGIPYGFFPNGQPAAIPHRTVHPFFAPVGGINATGNDMARYMIAQLDAGRSEQAILSQDSFARMHSQIRSNHPLSSGFGMIYFTLQWNGETVVIHGGDWPGTHSIMVLLPRQGTGVFFSIMGEYPEVPLLESLLGSERLTPVADQQIGAPISNYGVLMSFLATFLGPYEKPQLPAAETADLEEYVGSYVAQSAAVSTMERMLALVNPFTVVDVELGDDRSGLYFNGVGPYRQIGEDVFWSDDVTVPLEGLFLDSPIFVFGRDAGGNVDFLSPQVGFDAWIKSGPLENPKFVGSIWGLLTVLCLTGLIAAFYPGIPGQAWAKWLPVVVAALLLVLPLSMLLGYPEGQTLIDALFFGEATRFIVFKLTTNCIAVVALIMGWQVVRAWRDRYWASARAGMLIRLHYSVVGVAALLLIAVFWFFNLVGV